MKRLVGLAGLLLLLLCPGPSWARGGGGCLEEGTPIRTLKGLVAIEKLEVGDPVWSMDSGQLREAKVRAVIRVVPEEYLELSAGGTRVRVTPEHPIMVAPGTYRQAGFLSPGDLVFLYRAGTLEAAAVQSINRLPGVHPAFNLLVSPGGTFISGDLVLHNKGCFLPDSPILRADGTETLISALKPGDTLWAFQPDGHLVPTRTLSVIRLQADEYFLMKTDRITLRVTAEHPFYVGRGTFKTVEALVPGDTILAFDGKWLAEQRIVSLERVRERVQVYNLQTDQPHTFFAGGLAVHNKGGGCFPAGTGIATPKGQRPIEALAAGDEVLSIDPEGRTVRSLVKTILINKGPLLTIKTAGGSLPATEDHPISLGEGRFRPAGDLRPGNRITRWKEGRLVAQKVREVDFGLKEGLVFNLEVEGPHTFIAEGVVVHNKGGGCLPAATPIGTLQGLIPIERISKASQVQAVDPQGKMVFTRIAKIFSTRALVLTVETNAGLLRATADHPVGCPDGAFVPAGRLYPGQQVLVWKNDALQAATVLRTRWEERPQPVYNLSVGWPNTFLASGFVTHNKGGGGSRSSGSSSSSGGRGQDLTWTGFFLFCFGLVFFMIILPIIIHAIKFAISKKKGENLDFVYPRNQITPKAEKTEKLLAFLSRQDSSVSSEALRNLAEATFLKLQECWGKREYGPMGALLLPDLYTQHTAQLQGLARNREINRIDDLKVERIDLVNVRYTEKVDQREFTALITASARDYYLDDRSGKFLRGDQTPARFQEFWTFQLLNGRWLLREIEQAGEADILKDENYAEMLTEETLKGIYGTAAVPQGPAGPWLEKEVEQKATRIDRMINFLSQTDKLWNRNRMLERARQVFLDIYLARESGDPARVAAADLFPKVAEDLKTQVDYWKNAGVRVEYRNLCVRKVELLLVRNFADNTRDEFTVRISAHAQRVIRQGDQSMSEQEFVTPFEEYWTFGRLDGRWKLKEVLPPGQGKKAVDLENVDEDSSPGQLQWYYRQPRVP
jgi:predicted lipid-binding transport protein (Tim44 family)